MIAATLLAAIVAAVPSAAAPALPALPIGGALVTHPGATIDGAMRARVPRATTAGTEHDGSSHAYAGIRIADALADAGVPTGDKVRGPAARAYLLVSAADGYTAVYALGELDTAEARCAPLLVDQRDGAPLPASTGPLSLVAPCDRTHARWVRSVTGFTIVVTPGSASPESMH